MPEQLEFWSEWIIGDLLQLPAADRTAALRRACGEDAPLRARVEALLSLLGDCDAEPDDFGMDVIDVPFPVGTT